MIARRLFAPEVIQSSAMDCGPAALKSLLGGFGIDVGYGRLREACSTDVDGTSIDTLEDLAVGLGLAAEQIMLPVDHLLIVEDVLPAILVVERPQTGTHFVVLWRTHGRFAQIMDPAVGRVWIRGDSLLRDVYRHAMPIDADDWRRWAGSDEFQAALLHRLRRVGVERDAARTLLDEANRDPSWKRLGTLDAAIRMLDELARGGGIDATSRIDRWVRRVCEGGVDTGVIPDRFWSVRPARDGESRVVHRGAVLVRVNGKMAPGTAPRATSATIAPELASTFETRTATVWAPFRDALRRSGSSAVGIAATALALATLALVVQSILLRGAVDIGRWLGIGTHRAAALTALGGFVTASLFLDVPVTLSLQRIGRRLEVFLRVAFSSKVPRIADHYFHSRLLTDMAERGHSLAIVRDLPLLVGEWLKTALRLLLTAAGVVWLAPSLLPEIAALVTVSFLLSLGTLPLLQERELRLRTYAASLVRFYFDALAGATCIRAHGAGRSILREQEDLLVSWAGAHRKRDDAAAFIEALEAAGAAAAAIWLIHGQIAREGQTSNVLLFTYWTLQLPILARALGRTARQLPVTRSVLVRALEPLGAPEETPEETQDDTPRTTRAEHEAPRIDMIDVTVRAGGHAVLEDVRLTIEAGSHVGVVGASGAGKSTLLGLLLGWHRPAEGSLLVDGAPLSADRLVELRRRTAWVDPTVQLHDRALLENLLYGAEDAVARVASAVDLADLRAILEQLPEGLQTTLGEGGALVSGGEGQRVRFGRALLRRDVRLALLDEPFRGLDREHRRLLLRRARRFWSQATMICATHDVSETLELDRVVVIAGGRIVEDDTPRVLAAREGSHYQRMLSAEERVRSGFHTSPMWRRLRVDRGVLSEQAPSSARLEPSEEQAPSSRVRAADD